MKWLPAVLIVVVLPVAFLVAGAAAQEGAKEKKAKGVKSRLPTHWTKLDLTDEQKQQYMSQAKDDLVKEEKLDIEVRELREKASKLNDELKHLRSGDKYMSILTESQKIKLSEMKAASAQKSAEKAVAKANRLATKAEMKTEPKAAEKENKAKPPAPVVKAPAPPPSSTTTPSTPPSGPKAN